MSRQQDTLLQFQLSPSYGRSIFIGRDHELSSLKNYILNGEGGTILLGGVRGAGKTHFLEELETQLGDQKDQNIFFVKVVLHEDIEDAELRYVMLRTICYSLINIENKLKWWKLNGISFFSTYFLGWLKDVIIRLHKLRIKRAREFNLLMRLVSYTKATEKVSYESSAGVRSRALSLDGKIASALDGELDLSNSRLEQILRNYLKAVSGLGVKIVFIFDELDKFEHKDQGEVKRLFTVVAARKFKNLLTQSGTFSIFITSDRDLRMIRKFVNDNPYCVEHTLFSKTVLINQLSPEAFSDVVSACFHESEVHDPLLEEVKDYILWQTGLHLFSLKQIFDQHKEIIKGVSYFEIDSAEITIESSLQHILSSVYWENESTKSDYFNRLLYLCLRGVALKAFNSQAIYFNDNNFLLAIVGKQDFDKDKFGEFLYDESFSPKSYIKYFSEDDWRHELCLLEKVDLRNINKAIEQLLRVLDAANLLRSKGKLHTGAEIYEVEFNLDKLDYWAINRDFDFAHSESMEDIKLHYNKISKLAKRINLTGDSVARMFEKAGGNPAIIHLLNSKNRDKIKIFSWELKNAEAVLETIELQLYSDIVFYFADTIGKKLASQNATSLTKLRRALREKSVPHKFMKIKIEDKFYALYFILCRTINEHKYLADLQKDNEIIVNIMFNYGKSSILKSWYDISFDPQLNNFHTSVNKVIASLKKQLVTR